MSNDLVAAETGAVTIVTNATMLLQAITRAASDPSMDMDKMERLFVMHEKMVKAEAETAFNTALARAQSQMGPVVHNAANTQTNSKYAKLAAINKVITPIYTAEGFSISFNTADALQPGYLRTIAILSHSQGHSREYHLDMPPDEMGAKGTVNKTKVHATGSTSSYARRYLVCMIFNVTTEDDTDGNSVKKLMPEGTVSDWLAAMDACTTMAELEKVWSDTAKATTAVGDVEAHEILKANATTKYRALKAQPKPQPQEDEGI